MTHTHTHTIHCGRFEQQAHIFRTTYECWPWISGVDERSTQCRFSTVNILNWFSIDLFRLIPFKVTSKNSVQEGSGVSCFPNESVSLKKKKTFFASNHFRCEYFEYLIHLFYYYCFEWCIGNVIRHFIDTAAKLWAQKYFNKNSGRKSKNQKAATTSGTQEKIQWLQKNAFGASRNDDDHCKRIKTSKPSIKLSGRKRETEREKRKCQGKKSITIISVLAAS